MAGNLKPNVSDLRKEASYTVNSYRFYNSYPQCPLFDGKTSKWQGGSDAYWYDNTFYLDITINNDCNIYKLSQIDYYAATHQAPFTIHRYENGTWFDVTKSYGQVFKYTPSTWVKTISNLPKGRYKFTSKMRMDAEWYIERVNIRNYIYLKDNVIYGMKAVE